MPKTDVISIKYMTFQKNIFENHRLNDPGPLYVSVLQYMYLAGLDLLNDNLKCILEYIYLGKIEKLVKPNNLENRPFRNRENLQYKKNNILGFIEFVHEN